jgi:hypothetical protein
MGGQGTDWMRGGRQGYEKGGEGTQERGAKDRGRSAGTGGQWTADRGQRRGDG